MNAILKSLYDIQYIALIKIAPQVYKVKTKEKDYILKYLSDREVENVYSRLSMLQNKTFITPLKNKYGQYISEFEDRFFEISPYYEDEQIVAKDIRIHYYLNELAKLHNQSFFSLKVNRGFYEESYQFIENLIDQASKELETTLQSFERLDYKSPSQWLFIMNNQRFLLALMEARSHLDKFKELSKEKTMLRVCLNYLNFDYAHTIVKHEKIVSTHKMIVGPPIYDLKDLFDKSFQTSIDLSGFIEEYLKKFHLLDYEVEWLLSLLLIPIFDIRGDNEIDKIINITNTIHHIKNAQEIGALLTKTDEQDQDDKVED